MATILITGANRGIGLELATRLSARGDSVIAACRGASPELRELGIEIIEGIDVGSDESVQSLADALKGTRLDWLINNAGLLDRTSLDHLDIVSKERQFRINSLGPLRVTLALSRLLGGGSKVGIVSSRVGSLADNSSGGNYGYRMSKAAVNMAGVNLAHELRSREIAVFLLHPGYVRTGMTGGGGSKDASSAGRELIALMDRMTLADTGSFWHADGYQLPW